MPKNVTKNSYSCVFVLWLSFAFCLSLDYENKWKLMKTKRNIIPVDVAFEVTSRQLCGTVCSPVYWQRKITVVESNDCNQFLCVEIPKWNSDDEKE